MDIFQGGGIDAAVLMLDNYATFGLGFTNVMERFVMV